MVLFAFMRLIPIVGIIIEGKTIVEGFVPAYEQIENLRAKAADMAEPSGDLEFDRLQRGIALNRISFHYPNRKAALTHISIQIPKHQMVAFVGKSGAGKTTAADMILGLYRPDSGQVEVDGIPLQKYNMTSYRQRIGYVPQDPILFNASVRENLLWAAPDATEKDIWSACAIANADEFVAGLSERLDTVLGDRGTRLSGGQRQRLALARAIIRRPSLLILDKATSALDSESERLIQEAINYLTNEMTIVVVAHRLSTVKAADRIYVFQEGHIAEAGTFRELSERTNSLLSDMIREQAL